MRMIDADKLVDMLYDNEFAVLCPLDEVSGVVDACPTVDAVPVVRCKECKWFADNNDGEWYGCQMFQVVRITPEDAPKPDDFCSYGERKENNHEKV